MNETVYGFQDKRIRSPKLSKEELDERAWSVVTPSLVKNIYNHYANSTSMGDPGEDTCVVGDLLGWEELPCSIPPPATVTSRPVDELLSGWSSLLKLWRFANENNLGFTRSQRRRRRQRGRQVYFKSSTDSGSVRSTQVHRSTLLAARTILERTTEVGRHRLSSIRYQSDKIKRSRKHGFADANKK